MKLNESLSFNDPIHDRIILNEIECSVVSHKIFQRLRRIKALGFLDRVFGSARHSRFEHSIGACHVVSAMMDHLKTNHLAISDLSQWSKDSSYTPWTELNTFLTETRIKQVRLAALLHDIGHGPFSHASETIMPLRKSLISENNDLPTYVIDALNKKDETCDKKQADHEDFSLILAWRVLNEIKPNHGEINEDFIKDVLAIKFQTVEPSNLINQAPFALLRNFVDGEFDGDRMDYLIRDSFFCGVPYGNFDLERLLEGLYVLESKTKELKLGIKRSSLTAFEDFLFARFQMHVQVYSHRVDAAFNCALETITSTAAKLLPASIDGYVEVDDENFLETMNFKSDPSLRSLLLERRKWKLLYETNDKDDAIASKLNDAINVEIGPGFCGVNKSKRLFRKIEVLKLPVVMTSRKKKFKTEDLQETALVLNRYEHEFFVRRVFVDPEKFNMAEAILEKMESEIANLPKNISKTLEELSAVKNSLVVDGKKVSGSEP